MGKQVARFIVNDRPYEVLIEPQTTLAELLRDQLDLTGTKFNCEVGECGCCTVIIDSKLARSCLTLAITVREKNILTIEGLAKGNILHPLQQAFIDYGAIQCGFCTPGMLLTAKVLLDKNPEPTREEVKEALSANLCRCTGYVKIIDAVLGVAERVRGGTR